MRRTIEIIGLTNPSGAGRVSANLPVPLDYIAYVPYNDDAASDPTDITQIKESLNADPVRDYTGSDQDAMNVFDRMLPFDATAAPVSGSALVIPNEMKGMLSASVVYGTTRNCLSPDPETKESINSIKLEWVQTSANSWRLFAVVDDAIKGGPGAITRILTFEDVVAGGGETSSYNKIPFGNPKRRWFRRMFSTLSAGDYVGGDVRILRDETFGEIFKRTKLLNDQLAGDDNKRLPDTAVDVLQIDTTETGISEMFDTMKAVDPTQKMETDVPMGGEFVRSRIFDIRTFPSAGATERKIIETVGRL